MGNLISLCSLGASPSQTTGFGGGGHAGERDAMRCETLIEVDGTMFCTKRIPRSALT